MFPFTTVRYIQNKSRIKCLNFWICATQGQVRRGTYFDIFPLFIEVGVMNCPHWVISITANISSFGIQTRISHICITLCVNVYISSAFVICRTCSNSVWPVLSPHLHPAINTTPRRTIATTKPLSVQEHVEIFVLSKIVYSVSCRALLLIGHGSDGWKSKSVCIGKEIHIYYIMWT